MEKAFAKMSDRDKEAFKNSMTAWAVCCILVTAAFFLRAYLGN